MAWRRLDGNAVLHRGHLREEIGLATHNQTNDEELLWQLYRRYFAPLCAYLAGIVRESHTAEDLAHDVFYRLVTGIATYRSERGDFGPWLFRIAHNAAIDHLRQRQRVKVVDPDEIRAIYEVATAAGDDWPGASREHAFLQLISELPLEQRRVLALRYLNGLRSPEIARVMEKTPSAVRQIQRRGLLALADNVPRRRNPAQPLARERGPDPTRGHLGPLSRDVPVTKAASRSKT